MITLEQKKKLQIDAHTPHLPTDLTYECRIAISGEGSRAQDWSDKPHRLVYDLSRQVESDAVRIEDLEESNKELTLQLLAVHGQAADALDKLAKAVEALREIITRWDTPAWKDAEATGSVINRARATLAELEGGE